MKTTYIALFIASLPIMVYGQHVLEDKNLHGKRIVLNEIEEDVQRSVELKKYQMHIENAATLRQAKEDYVYACYELSYSYLRALNGDIIKNNSDLMADKMIRMILAFPIDDGVAAMEASMFLPMFGFMETLDDENFYKVLSFLKNYDCAGVSDIWFDVLKSKLFEMPEAEIKLDRLMKLSQGNAYFRCVESTLRLPEGMLQDVKTRYRNLNNVRDNGGAVKKLNTR